MALYEFDCPQCHMTFDILRPISRMDEVVKCPYCGSSDIHKHWQLFSIVQTRVHEHEPEPISHKDTFLPVNSATGPYIHDCYIHHCGRGIVANSVDVRLKNMHFSHNTTDIEARNANIHVEGDFQSD